MTDWIKINLPWDHRGSGPETISYPNLDKEVKEKFGYTKEELTDLYFHPYRYSYEHPDSREYDRLRDEIAQKIAKFNPNLDVAPKQNQILAELVALNNPRVNKVLEFREKYRELHNFIDNHPEIIKVMDENDKIINEYNSKIKELSFKGKGLVKAGTVIEVRKSSGKTEQMMIGDINELGGACDDCAGIADSDIVLRYKIVWEK